MGRTHAWSGAAAWLVAAPGVDTWLLPLSGRDVFAGALVTAGAALLNDLDHPSGTMARSWGPITRLASRLTVLVFGPHRRGTHSVAFVGLSAGLGTLAGLAGGWWAAVPVFLAVTMVVGFWRKHGLFNEVFGAVVAVATFTGEVGTAWLGFSLGIGTLLHSLGDQCTDKGQAWWWPVDRRMVDNWHLMGTGSGREMALRYVLIAVTLVLTYGYLIGDLYMIDTVRTLVMLARA